MLIVVAGFGFYSANSSDLASLVSGYQSDYSDYSPQGAILRIGVTTVFSVIFLLHKKAFMLSDQEDKVWTGINMFALLSVVALILGILPTLVDRLALYLLPIQLFVGSRLPGTHIFGITGQNWRLLLVSFSFCSFMCGLILLIIAGMVAVPQHSSLIASGCSIQAPLLQAFLFRP